MNNNTCKIYFQITKENAVLLVAEYVRTLPAPSNIDELVSQVFGSNSDKRALIFKQSVLYYLNGTANGFLKYCASGK